MRSSISRLKRRGVLEPSGPEARRATRCPPSARAILGEGDQRIFDRRRAAPDEGWLLAVFSVPEAERHRRHLLRSRLSWLGFGTVSAGVWVAPAHHVERRPGRSWSARGCRRTSTCSGASHLVASTDVRRNGAAAGGTWRALRGLYEEFLRTATADARRWKRRRRTDDMRQAFADHAGRVTAWRRLPFLDPGLAADLLPTRWHGRERRRHVLRPRTPAPAAPGFVTGARSAAEAVALSSDQRTAMPCTSTSASASQSRVTPMAAIAG